MKNEKGGKSEGERNKDRRRGKEKN